MTTESNALREALFAQMSAPPLPEYSGHTVILRACKMPSTNSVAHHILPPCADASHAPSNVQPSFNVCPTDTVDVVVRGDEKRVLIPTRWGLVPSWWKRLVTAK